MDVNVLRLVTTLAVAAALASCADAPHRSDTVSKEPAQVTTLRARARAGDVEASVMLAEHLVGMSGVAPEVLHGGMPRLRLRPPRAQLDEAVGWLEAAVERGSARAMLCYAWCYEGKVLPRWGYPYGCLEPAWEWVRAEARRWYQRAAALGDVAGMSAYGRRLEADEAGSGLEWLRRAARARDAAARQQLAISLAARPDLRQAGDGELMSCPPSDPRVRPWPPSSCVDGLEPFLPRVDRSEPGAGAVRLAASGRGHEAEAAALELLRSDGRHPRAAIVLAACDLRRAAAGARLDLSIVGAAQRLLWITSAEHPTDAELAAALAMCETWQLRAHGEAGTGPTADQALYLAAGDPHVTATARALGATDDAARADRARGAVALALEERARRQVDRSAREADLDLALLHAPDFARAAEQRARLRAWRRDLAGAEEDLTRALEAEQDSNHVGPRLRARAHARMRRGALAGARADLERALTLATDDLDARALLGLVSLAGGDRARALDDLERAMADRWLAAAGADPTRRWHERLDAQAGGNWFWLQHSAEYRSSTQDVARQLAALCLGRASIGAVVGWLHSVPDAVVEHRGDVVTSSADPMLSGRAHALALAHALHGLSLERAGEVDDARRHYREAVAEKDALESAAISWATQRLLTLEDR